MITVRVPLGERSYDVLVGNGAQKLGKIALKRCVIQRPRKAARARVIAEIVVVVDGAHSG